MIYCEIESGDIIYVQRKLHSTDRLDNIQIPKVSNHRPESFINQKMWVNETIGTIVDISHNESGIIWIVELQEGYKWIDCTEEDITEGMRLYYTAHDGIENDFANYLLHIMQKNQAGMEQFVSQLQQKYQSLGSTLPLYQNYDDDVFSIIKLEHEMSRSMEFNLHIEPWMSTEKRLYVVRQSLTSLREYLPALSKLKKEILIKSKSTKVSKPIIDEREVVYVTIKEGVPERGMIKTCKEYDDIDGYGPRRTYSILLDNGDLLDDVDDYQVLLRNEYMLLKHLKESNSKGVKHICNKDSSDPWARERGWYTVNIDEVEETFVHLSDALRAYDISQAKTKGDDLKESDLNLPRDWISYFKARASGNDEDLKWYGATVKDQISLTACLFVSYKRIQNPTMKTIWKALVFSSEPNVMLGGFNLGLCWKQAWCHYLEGNSAQMEYRLYVFALWRICIHNVSLLF